MRSLRTFLSRTAPAARRPPYNAPEFTKIILFNLITDLLGGQMKILYKSKKWQLKDVPFWKD